MVLVIEIETMATDPAKHLNKLPKFLKCGRKEVFGSQISGDMEEGFLNDSAQERQ